MIRVERQRPPAHFDEQVRQPGLRWLENPNNRQKKRPRDFWTRCRDDLERQFEWRCGYAATRITSGQTDHFISWRRCQHNNEHHRAYEWGNLRWIAPELNSLKGTHDVLDPFEVHDDWFELRLPSLRLHMTDAIPVELRPKAAQTIRILKLESGPLVRKWRQAELQLFAQGLPLEEVLRRTPLLGRALEKLFAASTEQLDSEQRRFRANLETHRRRASAQD